jgi:hypothetical protein
MTAKGCDHAKTEDCEFFMCGRKVELTSESLEKIKASINELKRLRDSPKEPGPQYDNTRYY